MTNKNEIINRLKENEIVCVPTDTVYGLVALAKPKNGGAIAKLKGNTEDKPYTIMVKDIKQALEMWEKNPLVESLVSKHFPGDLTIIAKIKNSKEMLGIRIPDNKVLIDIIKEVGPIYATSTNKSGGEPLNNTINIKKVFPNIAILDGECGNKKPSTIVKINNLKMEIIRVGDKLL